MVSIQLIDRSYGRICTTSTLQDSSMHKVDFVGLMYGIRYFRRQLMSYIVLGRSRVLRLNQTGDLYKTRKDN